MGEVLLSPRDIEQFQLNMFGKQRRYGGVKQKAGKKVKS